MGTLKGVLSRRRVGNLFVTQKVVFFLIVEFIGGTNGLVLDVDSSVGIL